MTIKKESAASFTACTPSAIVYDIQVSAAAIAQKVGYNIAPLDGYIMKRRLQECNKSQLKAIAAELRTVEKRLAWILDGQY